MSFSLRFLFCITTIEAIGCLALLKPTAWGASLFVSLTIAAVVIAVMKALVEQEAKKAFYVGFAFVATVYICLAMLGLGYGISSSLITTKMIVFLEAQLQNNSQDKASTPDWATSIPTEYLASMPGMPGIEKKQAFYRTGHALTSLLLGCMGGFALQWLRYEKVVHSKRKST